VVNDVVATWAAGGMTCCSSVATHRCHVIMVAFVSRTALACIVSRAAARRALLADLAFRRDESSGGWGGDE